MVRVGVALHMSHRESLAGIPRALWLPSIQVFGNIIPDGPYREEEFLLAQSRTVWEPPPNDHSQLR
jgi:hypothetical protein